MTRPSLFEGAAVAALASVAGSLLHAGLPLFVYPATADKLIVLILGGGYLIYLLSRSADRAGRVVTVLIWLGLAGLLWFSQPSNGAYLAAHLVILWLVRARYFQAGPLSAAGDGLLVAIGFLLGTGAYVWSGSLFAAIWTFFLIQALFTLFADRWERTRPTLSAADTTGFETAYRSAEAALEKLSTQHQP